jgi:hypothetical protein
MRHKKIAELEIPEDYFELSPEDKETICMVIMDNLLRVIDKKFNPTLNRIDLMNKLLDSSIQTNINEETYEVAQVLSDIKQILNEVRVR